MNINGIGKPIKIPRELKRAQRINLCLNKCVRNCLNSKNKADLDKNIRKFKRWQKLTFYFYEIYDIELDNLITNN